MPRISIILIIFLANTNMFIFSSVEQNQKEWLIRNNSTTKETNFGTARIFFEDIFGSPSIEAEEKEPLGNCTCGRLTPQLLYECNKIEGTTFYDLNCRLCVMGEVIWCNYPFTFSSRNIRKFPFTFSSRNIQCGVINQEIRIVGGMPTGVNRYPWVARLVYDGKFHCGASLINNDYVLTAAHCVRRLKRSKIRVILGDHDQTVISDSESVMRAVSSIVRHRHFDVNSYNHDIALLKLRKPVNFSKTVRPVCLPPEGLDPAGMTGTVVGWGRTSEGGTLASVIQEVQVPILTLNQCRNSKYKPTRITPNMICAGKGVQDSCQGDSGGPLLVNSSGNDKLELAGIVSWGVGCGRPGYPGVYTRVNRYLDWVKRNMRDTCLCNGGLLSWSGNEIRNRFDASTTEKSSYSERRVYCECTCGIANEDTRIVGGAPTEPHEFPWMVRLSYFNKFYCGGTLVNDKYVVTAAHCVKGFLWFLIKVTLGEHDRCNQTRKPETRFVLRVFASNFSFFNFDHDIAILRLNDRVPITDTIRPICLPKITDEEETYEGKNAKLAGWGILEEGGKPACILRVVNVPIINQETCVSRYPNGMVTENMMCAGYDEGQKDSCQVLISLMQRRHKQNTNIKRNIKLHRKQKLL
ncbi:hypothetical protein PGB90_010088 [Kerria lacca]